MKRQYIYMVCATALLSGCHIYKAYDRPESIETNGIYRDPIAEASPLATTDTTNIANLPWQEVFQDPQLQALIEEGLANNVDMQNNGLILMIGVVRTSKNLLLLCLL